MNSTATDAFAHVRRARAQAEFAEWNLVLTHREREIIRIDAGDEVSISKELARRGIALEIAQRLGITENSVWRIVVQGEEVRDRTPAVWDAFRDGILDARRVGLIADAVAKLRTPEAVDALDQSAVGYAAEHTPGELRGWLKRLRARLEPEQFEDEAARAIEQRRVEISHNDDGTSWLSALLPTGVAVAVGNRLRAAAKALPKIDPETGERDRRTRDQKQADLVAHWLTCSEGTSTDIRAEIAITIDSTDLIGLTPGAGFTRRRTRAGARPVGARTGHQRAHAPAPARARPPRQRHGHDEARLPAQRVPPRSVALARRHLPGRRLPRPTSGTPTSTTNSPTTAAAPPRPRI